MHINMPSWLDLSNYNLQQCHLALTFEITISQVLSYSNYKCQNILYLDLKKYQHLPSTPKLDFVSVRI